MLAWAKRFNMHRIKSGCVCVKPSVDIGCRVNDAADYV